MVTMAVLWGGLMSFGMAEDLKATKSPGKTVQASAENAASAGLRAEIHRTLAALIEARSAAKPDQAKVDELAQKLQQLREKLQTQNTAANAAAGWGCPSGGPGPGYGRGAGRGGAGRGAGFGPGAGRGWGPGAGRGWGPGAGRGQGFGPGAGQGLAPGGAAFVDKDNDGVCDYYELRHGMHK
jgi:hypothetical protein